VNQQWPELEVFYYFCEIRIGDYKEEEPISETKEKPRQIFEKSLVDKFIEV
jgi:hypothetical protein